MESSLARHILAAVTSCVVVCLCSAAPVLRPDLSALFQPEQTGWLGADVALSIALDEGEKGGLKSYLWVWGDTLVGNMIGQGQNARRNITRMPHDSFGLMNVDESTKLSSPTYFLPKSNQGFFVPPTVPHLPLPKQPYYCVVSGLAPFILGRRHLFFVAMAIQSANNSFGFAQVGSDVIFVNETDAESASTVNPANWGYRTARLPHSESACSWNSGVAIADADGHPVPDGVDSMFVYMIGRCAWVEDGAFLFGGALSRIPLDAFLRVEFESITYWSKGETWLSHSEFELDKLKMLFPSSFTEGVLTFNEYKNAWYIMLCQSLGPHVNLTMSQSSSIYSNWTMRTVYEIPAAYSNISGGVVSYAAKQHPEFAPGKNDRYVVFSFNTNMLTLSPLSKRVDIYTPRFVQVDLSEFF